MMAYQIETSGIVKDYRLGVHVVHAVREVSIRIRPGEFVAIMGASGSGKSTFMNLLGCLDTPTSGDYFLEGEDVSELSRDTLARIRNQKIGFVFQTFNLLSRTSAQENVELPLLYSGINRHDKKRRAREKLEAVGLTDWAHHNPSQLSGGQQQRVAIARALVNDPVLILADEPTGNLDSQTGVEIMSLFQELNRNGITIVLVTHEADIAGFAKRILHFRDGVLVRDAEVAEPKSAEEVMAAAGGAFK
jgi:putative ABC transport system ATP-binding protein